MANGQKRIPPAFYLYVYAIMKEHFQKRYIGRTDVLKFLRGWNVPKPMRQTVLKEMNEMGLLIIESKYQIKLEEVDTSRVDHVLQTSGKYWRQKKKKNESSNIRES